GRGVAPPAPRPAGGRGPRPPRRPGPRPPFGVPGPFDAPLGRSALRAAPYRKGVIERSRVGGYEVTGTPARVPPVIVGLGVGETWSQTATGWGSGSVWGNHSTASAS